ncbi:hypothetical protein [Arachidicoccus sp.]|uniref:hypothetical protein n=1 Tax=Arachidicoccus sp. TaxID=1872624 RepID=UPI003D21CA99
MACKTASVQRVADKTSKAKEQIDKLQQMIESQEADNKAKFFAQIKAHLSDANITDERQIDYNSNVKTEYTSEFSLEKISKVVIASLHAAKAATDPAITNPATSPAAIDAYVDIVNTVAEAAKSSSTAAASLSFSMNRLSPGMFVFLYASSLNIQDDETFGKEAVTTTAIYYRMVQSIQDLKLQGAFDAARIEVTLNVDSYKKFKLLQVALIDDLSNEKIDLDQYIIKDKFYGDKAKELKAKIDAVAVSHTKLLAKGNNEASDVNQKLIHSAIIKLSSMGDSYKTIIRKVEDRITNGYF